MSIPEAFIAEVRDRVLLSGLIGRTVKLEKAGREFKACCPFHDERSASFYVNDDKAFYHCFGCGANGDAIKWLTEGRGATFIDALRELAESVGMALPAPDARTAEREARDTGLHAVMERAAEMFAAWLAAPEGEQARAYLRKRGVTAEHVQAYGIGLAPDSRTRLREALRDAGDDALRACGLVIDPEGGGQPYDRFRGRLMFPIRNARGAVIAFGGRILGAGEPKYLNSPEGPLFDKGRTLFNLHRAGPIARKSERIVVVEGYFDCVGLDHVGIGEAVAPMGTALTEAQLERLWRLSPTPTLCFDGDGAGRRAAVRAATRALPLIGPGRSLQFALLPEGRDPDDLARSGGRAAVAAVLDRAMPLHELLWSHEYFAAPLDTPEARAGLGQRLQQHAATIADDDVRREYQQLFRERMFPTRRRYKPVAPAAPADLASVTLSPERLRRKMIIALLKGLARFPDVTMYEFERIDEIAMPDDACTQARELLLGPVFHREAVAPEQIAAMFPDDCGWKGLTFLFNRTLKPEQAEPARAMLVRLIEAMRGIPVELEAEEIYNAAPIEPALPLRHAPAELDDEVPF